MAEYKVQQPKEFSDEILIARRRETRLGGTLYPISEINATSTLKRYVETTLVDASSAAVTVNLPYGIKGERYSIVKVDNTSNNVLIDPNGSETIIGASTYSLPNQYDAITIQFDGTEWFALSNF